MHDLYYFLCFSFSVFSLRERCLQVIRSLIPKHAISMLEIPQTLQQELLSGISNFDIFMATTPHHAGLNNQNSVRPQLHALHGNQVQNIRLPPPATAPGLSNLRFSHPGWRCHGNQNIGQHSGQVNPSTSQSAYNAQSSSSFTQAGGTLSHLATMLSSDASSCAITSTSDTCSRSRKSSNCESSNQNTSPGRHEDHPSTSCYENASGSALNARHSKTECESCHSGPSSQGASHSTVDSPASTERGPQCKDVEQGNLLPDKSDAFYDSSESDDGSHMLSSDSSGDDSGLKVSLSNEPADGAGSDTNRQSNNSVLNISSQSKKVFRAA